MKGALRVIALVVALGAVTCWFATGAHRGWTQTKVPVKTVDEVTGIEGVKYEDRFVMGVELLGAALLGAGILAGISFLFRNKTKQTENQ